MSISTATDRLASPRRLRPRHIVVGLLLAVVLIGLVLAVENTSTTAIAGRVSTRPGTITATQSQRTGHSVSSVPGHTFRDPVSHALLAVGTPAAPQAESGLGHR